MIVVVGSINIDLVTQAKRMPQAGESIIGDSFHTFFGGKGANQAVAASRLGADVYFIGCVGNDSNGIEALANLKENSVNVEGISIVNSESTGVAQITVTKEDNSIIIVKGANKALSTSIIDKNIDLIKRADLVLLQLEIPLETVEYVIDICDKEQIISILNPAPAQALSLDIIDKVTYITPNEVECASIFKENEEDILKRYPNKLIVTKGKNGVCYNDHIKNRIIAAERVKALDTTGAGDTFNGAFAASVVSGNTVEESIAYANKAAALSIRKIGAQSAMPFKDDLQYKKNT